MLCTCKANVCTKMKTALFITHIRSFYYAYHKEHMPEGNYVFCFTDDIILATESEELHYKIIEVIFYICTQYGLTLKCGCASSVAVLHIMSSEIRSSVGNFLCNKLTRVASLMSR